MKPRMQLLQERLGYDLTITSVKFMQQTTSPSSEGDSSVCNWLLLQYTYLIDSPKIKTSAVSM